MNDQIGEAKYLHLYHGEDGLRWVVVSENTNKVANGGQGYTNKEDIVAVLNQLFGRPATETKSVGTCGMGHLHCAISELQNRSGE